MMKSKKRERNLKVQGIDIISSLPDEILTHMLSFLHTIEAVRTCILSKRWRNIWAFVPILNLKFDDYKGSVHDELSQSEVRFDQFVRGWLDHRQQSPFDLFLHHSDGFTKGHLDDMYPLEWLDAAPIFPKVISIILYRFVGFYLPHSMFSSTTLQHLELDIMNEWSHTDITLIPSVNLPSLRTLFLSHFWINDVFIQELFSGCPMLESVDLSWCSLDISKISSSVLKNLKIHKAFYNCQMQISCPSLLSLDILDGTKSVKDMALPSLVSANIQTYDDCDLKLDTFSNATCLKLITSHPDTMERLEKDIPQCNTFDNLRRLELGNWYKENNFDLVAFFLENSPLLEKLNLHLAFLIVHLPWGYSE